MLTCIAASLPIVGCPQGPQLQGFSPQSEYSPRPSRHDGHLSPTAFLTTSSSLPLAAQILSALMLFPSPREVTALFLVWLLLNLVIFKASGALRLNQRLLSGHSLRPHYSHCPVQVGPGLDVPYPWGQMSPRAHCHFLPQAEA